MKGIAITILTMLITVLKATALSVGDLTVNTLTNPQGIDTNDPKFGWVIHSDERDVWQQSYEISLYSDAACSQLVWTSGEIASDASQYVTLSALQLIPASRYYWRVNITDNKGQQAQSAETAYFDTGLMGNWGDARWIKPNDNAYGIFMPNNGISEYTIDADIEIDNVAAALCFSKGNDDSMMMWRVDVSTEGDPRFQPYEWIHGDTVRLADISIKELGIEAHKPFHLRIEVCDNDKISHTYINGNHVYIHQADYTYSQLGIKQFINNNQDKESAYFDNIVVTDLKSGNILFSADFTTTNYFTMGEVVDRRLYVEGTDRFRRFNWQIAGYVGMEIDADVTILKGAPGLYFGYRGYNAYLLWQIVTDGPQSPLLRQRVQSYTDDVWQREVPLKGFTNDDFVGKEHRLHISAYNTKVITSIDGVPVDTMMSPRKVTVGRVGFSADKGDEGYFDNLKVQLTYPNGATFKHFSEDFESGISTYFTEAEITDVNGNNKCHVSSAVDGYRLVQLTQQAPVLVKEYVIDRPIARAVLYTTALGVYDLWINGQRVGHQLADGTTEYEEMKPGWTDYRYRVAYSTHDITGYCTDGINTIGAILAPGWLRGEVAKRMYNDIELAFLCKLIITYADGSQMVVDSDESWRSSKDGKLISSDIYHGEIYNAMHLYPWEEGHNPYLNGVDLYEYDGKVESQRGLTVKVLNDNIFSAQTTTLYRGIKPGTDYGMINIISETSDIKPITLNKGETVIFDFGQNHTGIPRFTVRGKRGCIINLRTAEMLNDTGEESRGNDGPGGSLYKANYRSAKSELAYTLSGDTKGEQYQSNTVFYGYRYVEITATADIEILQMESLPISSSNVDIGSISTDNELVNRLFQNCVWGQRSNLVSVPTDCPQRDERLGWAADTQIFSNSAMYNARTSEFYAKWLTDMRDAQRDDGAFSDIAPLSLQIYSNGGWADAGIIVTWNTYLMSGNKAIIKENYEAMTRYMEWLSTQKSRGIEYAGAGTAYGDWRGLVETLKRYISVSFYAYDVKLMEKMSYLLSERNDDVYCKAAERYGILLKEIIAEMQKNYFSENSTMEHTQTSYALALQFGLYKDDEQKEQFSNNLSALIKANGYKLNTGFIGTAYINTALSIAGLDDCAYNLLLQRENPSWLYSIDQGATTMWERWDSYTRERGFGDASMNSFNHYAYGAVCEWMYRDMAGISTSEEYPGFKKIVLAPKFEMREMLPEGQERIKNVKAKHDSPYGTIISEWTIDDDGIYTYHVVIPANTRAEVRLPVRDETQEILESGIFASRSEGVTFIGYDDGMNVYDVASGEYTFTLLDSRYWIEAAKPDIMIYPNPVKDKVYIKTPLKLNMVTILSKAGILLRSFDSDPYVLDLSDLSPDLYFMVVETDETAQTFKIIRQR